MNILDFIGLGCFNRDNTHMSEVFGKTNYALQVASFFEYNYMVIIVKIHTRLKYPICTGSRNRGFFAATAK